MGCPRLQPALGSFQHKPCLPEGSLQLENASSAWVSDVGQPEGRQGHARWPSVPQVDRGDVGAAVPGRGVGLRSLTQTELGGSGAWPRARRELGARPWDASPLTPPVRSPRRDVLRDGAGVRHPPQRDQRDGERGPGGAPPRHHRHRGGAGPGSGTCVATGALAVGGGSGGSSCPSAWGLPGAFPRVWQRSQPGPRAGCRAAEAAPPAVQGAGSSHLPSFTQDVGSRGCRGTGGVSAVRGGQDRSLLQPVSQLAGSAWRAAEAGCDGEQLQALCVQAGILGLFLLLTQLGAAPPPAVPAVLAAFSQFLPLQLLHLPVSELTEPQSRSPKVS